MEAIENQIEIREARTFQDEKGRTILMYTDTDDENAEPIFTHNAQFPIAQDVKGNVQVAQVCVRIQADTIREAFGKLDECLKQAQKDVRSEMFKNQLVLPQPEMKFLKL